MPGANSAMDPGFHFSPLRKSDTIRLVRIEFQPLADDPRIRCTIQHFPDERQEVPSYDALSYVWGDKNFKKPILIRNSGDTEGTESRFSEHLVHKNLWEFLDQMSKSNHAQPWLWIDFLCVNQDSVQEKEEQIPRVGEIYSNARQTIAWLGRSDPSPSRIQPEQSVEHHMSQIPILLGQPPLLWESLRETFESGKRSWTDWVRTIRSVGHAPWANKGPSAEDLRRVVHSQIPKAVRYHPWLLAPVDKILSLAYWERVWIVQEVALAKKVELRFGDTTLDLHDFIRAYQIRFFYPWSKNSEACENEAIAAVEARIAGDDISIREIIEWSKCCECSIPIDRVDGLLALLRKQRPDPNTAKAIHAYLDAVFTTPLQRSGGIVHLADYGSIVDQMGLALLGQPLPSFDLKNLDSYSNDHSNKWELMMMARAAKRIAISCAAIGFGSARVLKDSFDWRPTTGSPQRDLFDYHEENGTMPLPILIALLSLRPTSCRSVTWQDEDDKRTVKAAVIGIRLANRVKRDSEWRCFPAEDKCFSCVEMHGNRTWWHEQLDITCALTSIEGADHPRSARPLCASRIEDHGHNCQGSTLFLHVEDVEHGGWRLRLTLRDGTSPKSFAALDISSQYCELCKATY